MRVFNGPSMRMRVSILEIRHLEQLCSSEPKMKYDFFNYFFGESVSWGSQESVEPMRVFNGPIMRMRVASLEIRHLQLLCSSEPKVKIDFFHIFWQNVSWGSQESIEPMLVFNGPIMRMRVAILEIRHLQLLCSSEPKVKIDFFSHFFRRICFLRFLGVRRTHAGF